MDISPPLIRAAMTANAAFSLATGALLASAPGAAAGWLGVSINGWLRLLGSALLGHGAVLIVLASSSAIRRWASLNLVAIAPYPILMVLIVLAGWVDRPLGIMLVLLDGLVVAVLAAGHALGLRQGVPRHQTQPA